MIRSLSRMLLAVTLFTAPSVHSEPIELKVGIYENEPKVLLGQSGQPSGILGDLLVEIAQRENWQLTAVPCEWEACLEAIQEGRLDLLPDVAENESRRQEMAFHTIPSLHSWSQIYRRGDVVIESVLDLDGKRIAVLDGSIQLEYLQSLVTGFDIDLSFVTISSNQEVLASIARGDADVMVANHQFGDYHAPDYNLLPTSIMFQPARLFYVAPLGQHQQVLDRIDRYLDAWRVDTASPYYQVIKRWNAGMSDSTLPQWILAGIALLTLLLLMAMGFTLLLRFQVRQKTHALQSSEQRLAAILGNVEAYIYIKGLDYSYQYASPKVCALFGVSEEEVLGKQDTDFFDADTASQLRENDRLVIEEGERVVEEERNQLPGESSPRFFLSVKLPLRHPDGTIYALCGVSTDITEKRQQEQEIHQLAFFDNLTGLPNRRLLQERMLHSMATCIRKSQDGAILFIDLDNFRNLNDTLGHHSGDIFLNTVAQRLSKHLREGDTLARIGGDEFALLLEGLDDRRERAHLQVEHIAAQILQDLQEPFMLQQKLYSGTASIGATLFSDAWNNSNEVLKCAELAMYEAKSAGRNQLRLFDPVMREQLEQRSEMENGLRQALAEHQFELHYQPQLNRQGRLLGVEALIRWNHSQQGMISPAAFIPTAEATGLIIPLGRWILRTACEQLVHWSRQEHTAHLRVAVNVSARQMHDPGFVEDVLNILDQTGADANLLELELTESLLIQDVEQAIAKMNHLKERGVHFSLDDFGTGYSSLSALKRLPLDQLKIDQGFVRDLLTDPNDAAIVRTVVALGQSLDVKVIAEGVETEEQRIALIELGCEAFQGYLFSRPLSRADLDSRLSTGFQYMPSTTNTP
ncbi:EAL domain-containing protein [Nitrincola alkalilacustris]|uniref:EAL domain-containing protein n=1 Tax=Nitrincola alkalilacustris TaxID=1571224 RepID=UPI001F0FC994|nr:EAL domain-containing protein [Nitrincola alkalilacustris]